LSAATETVGAGTGASRATVATEVRATVDLTAPAPSGLHAVTAATNTHASARREITLWTVRAPMKLRDGVNGPP